eukprot:scaffold5028_cov381-Prasinococcus_capsulatus_cf.AAC.6
MRRRRRKKVMLAARGMLPRMLLLSSKRFTQRAAGAQGGPAYKWERDTGLAAHSAVRGDSSNKGLLGDS